MFAKVLTVDGNRTGRKTTSAARASSTAEMAPHRIYLRALGDGKLRVPTEACGAGLIATTFFAGDGDSMFPPGDAFARALKEWQSV
jgi:hypothetical protein